MRSTFTFNGTASTVYGILVEHSAPIQRGEERVNNVIIPGRPGDLTIIEGEDIYNPYIQTLVISVPAANVGAVKRWLRGGGFATFSNEADRKQEARIINALNLEKVPHSLDWYRGDVEFYCQPIKRPLTDSTVTLASGATVNNAGDLPMLPIIKLTGSGDMSVSVLQNTIYISSVPTGGCVIDCEAHMVTNASGLDSLNASVSGDWPYIPVGTYAVNYTGATGCTLTKRERYL